MLSMIDLSSYKEKLKEDRNNALYEIYNRHAEKANSFNLTNAYLDFDSYFDDYLKYGEPENELTKEEIWNVYEKLDSLGLIDSVKNELAEFYRVKKEDLFGGMFLQNISYEVYKQKYQLKDGKNNEVIDLTPFHSVVRVALSVALVGTRYKVSYEDFVEDFIDFFYILASGRATGAGRIMSNAGSKLYKSYTSLINCTVMRQIPDSIKGIMLTLSEAAQTLKSGAGVGYDFSSIRPKGSYVYGAGAETSGVVSFAEIFDKMCSTIMSAGGRRGAQMAVIDLRHPESIDFFSAKRKDGTLRYFNISVLVPQSFLDKLEKDEDFEQWFWEFYGFHKEEKADEKDNYKVITLENGGIAVVVENGKLPFDYENFEYFAFPKSHELMWEETFDGNAYRIYRKRVFKTIKAREVYNVIMSSTYDYAEPGVIFIDNVNKNNPLRGKEYIRTTNPCGEQPLPPFGSCNLGSIFLHRFVKYPFDNTKKLEENFDFDGLYFVARKMNKFLDFVNDITNLPLKELKKSAQFKRRHGLGISGIADTLIMLGLRYGSDKAIQLLGKIMSVIQNASLDENVFLAEKLGPAPVDVKVKDWLDVFPHLANEDREKIKERSLRYSHAVSIAPTGTISLTWGNNVANGIEPTFSISYVRNIRVPGKKTKTEEVVYSFAAILYKNIFNSTEYPDYFVTTDDISVEEHIEMQAIAQKYTDSAISKTCNIPTDYPFEKFKEAYLIAAKKGLKGFTTFRFNPKFSVGVLVKKEDLDNMLIEFETDSGEKIVVKGSDKVFYDGEEHLAANLYEALKEGIYGKM